MNINSTDARIDIRGRRAATGSDAVLLPQFSQPHLRLGIGQYTQGNTVEALWNFFQSVGNEPWNPLGHYLCGLALKALNLDDEARVEWDLVLRLTSDPEFPLGLETDWLRGMAEKLLTSKVTETNRFPFRHLDEPNPYGQSWPAIHDPTSHRKDSRTVGQSDLERDIRSAVARYGACYVTDQFIANRLGASGEEQIAAWEQSFCERERFLCEPRKATLGTEKAHDGVVFRRL
jgi:hypothetical protein